MCVAPVYARYTRYPIKGPSAVPTNRKLPCILVVSCGSVCFFCPSAPFSPPFISTGGDMYLFSIFFSFLAVAPWTHRSNLPRAICPISFLFFSSCLTFFCSVSAFLKVPEWASPVDHTVGGVVLLWCLGSFKEPPVYGCLLFNLNFIPVLLISSQCTTTDHLQLANAFQANWGSCVFQNLTQ